MLQAQVGRPSLEDRLPIQVSVAQGAPSYHSRDRERERDRDASRDRDREGRAVRRIQNPGMRQESSSSSLASPMHPPATVQQILQIATEAMANALEENRSKTVEPDGSGVSNTLRPGITLDLSHKGIQKEFPGEVVHIIKDELERLALSHNQISSFPTSFSECTALRYLNVRNNAIKEFPLAICALASLEILDLGRNKLRILPKEIAGLTSLKVLSIQKNRIEDLPLCVADMISLQVLKLDGNPIRFPPKDVLLPQPISPPNVVVANESETNDVQVTAQVKKFLRQYRAVQDRSETESDREESSEGAETPRPMKRVMSGRFPIRVNGSDMVDLRSPLLPRAPPIPSRSHQRGLSQQTAAARRPNIMPLSIGNTNERLRSNSEGLLQATRDRNESRSRRMGIVSKKPDLRTPLDPNYNRYSHLRGLSHGSAMHNGIDTARSPLSPNIPGHRPTYSRRLSSLPEKKRKSSSPDPVIEGARGILYALDQIHPLISRLAGLSREDGSKRSSLEIVFYNASSQVAQLDQDIAAFDNYSEEDEETAPRSNEIVHSACLTCVIAYTHICGLLSRNVEALLQNGDPRYIRTLLLNVYGTLAEIRNSGARLPPPTSSAFTKMASVQETTTPPSPVLSDQTIRVARDKSLTPTRLRPGNMVRNRSATVMQPTRSFRAGTDGPQVPATRSFGRAATMVSTTPRSGESFTSNGSRTIVTADFTDEDRIFERIYLSLQQSSGEALKIIPTLNANFVRAMRRCVAQGDSSNLKHQWQALCQRCAETQSHAEHLRARLSQIKLKDPGVRTDRGFWELCDAFMNGYYHLVTKVKHLKQLTPLITVDDVGMLRYLQKYVKEAGILWSASPWSFITQQTPPTPLPPPTPSTVSSVSTVRHAPTSSSQLTLPVTPASAALGPAVQATVPSTPHSASSYNAMFAGNVFERADALLLSNGTHSRTVTMTSSFGTTDNVPATHYTSSPATSMSSRFNNSSFTNKVSF